MQLLRDAEEKHVHEDALQAENDTDDTIELETANKALHSDNQSSSDPKHPSALYADGGNESTCGGHIGRKKAKRSIQETKLKEIVLRNAQVMAVAMRRRLELME